MWSKDKEESHSFPIVELSGVFMRFRPLKDLLAVQEVTGRVHSTNKRALMLGYSEET